MATEKQCDFYKLLYDEENTRLEQLRAQARNYLSLATLYSAFVLYVADKVLPNMNGLLKLIFITGMLSMAASFVLSLLVLQASNFEAIAEPEDVTDQFGNTSMSDEVFFDNRIADFTVAYERNSVINDRKASLLECAGYALVLGIFLHAGFFVLKSI